MNKITLRKITKDNFDDVMDLSDALTDFQKQCVAPNVYSLAEAYANGSKVWPRAVYLDDKPIGFIMLALQDKQVPEADRPGYYLWRMMIIPEYQRLGYGTRVLDMLVKKCKRDQQKVFYTSCQMKGPQPYAFYMKYGFTDTGLNDGEQILKMPLNRE